MGEINHVRRLKREEAVAGQFFEPPLPASGSLPGRLLPAFSHLSGSATVPNTSSQRPVDGSFKWLRFFGLLDSGF